jgi:hypothetical protein
MGPTYEVCTNLIKTIAEAREGKFKTDRENDELTCTLKNLEHPGRTRDKGIVPWKVGFSECNDTYKSHQRKRKLEADRF